MSKPRNGYTSDDLAIPGVAFHPDIEDPKARVQAYMDTYKASPIETFDESLMKEHLELVDATASPHITATFRMTVTQKFCSRIRNMHGGAVSLLFDMCTTMCAAPAAKRDFWSFGGVSRTLNVTFLRPIKEGSRIRIYCEVLHIGSRLAAIRGQITDESDGKLLAVAEHNKASITFDDKSRL